MVYEAAGLEEMAAWTPRNRLRAEGGSGIPESLAERYFATREWWELRAVILRALDRFPGAREEVAQALGKWKADGKESGG